MRKEILDIQQWIDTTINNPAARIIPLCIHGAPDTGKTLLINYFKGYFEPYKCINQSDPQSFTFTKDLENTILCIHDAVPSNFKMQKHLLYSTELTIHERQQKPYQVPNYTHWIFETPEPLKDMLCIHLIKPLKISNINPMELGRQDRLKGILPGEAYIHSFLRSLEKPKRS